MADDKAKRMLVALAEAKAAAAAAAENAETIQGDLIAYLESIGQGSVSLKTDSGETLKGTVVRGTRVSIDAEALKKALGAKVWAKVTKQVLDTARLEAAVKVGVVDELTVATHSTVSDNKPYVRVTGDVKPSATVHAAALSGTPAHRKVRKPSAAKAALG